MTSQSQIDKSTFLSLSFEWSDFRISSCTDLKVRTTMHSIINRPQESTAQ